MARRDLGIVLQDIVDGHESHRRRRGTRRAAGSVLARESASRAGSFPRVRHLCETVSKWIG